MSPDRAFEPFADTVESLHVGFQVIGFDWRFVYVNPAAATHGRKTVAELQGQRLMDVYPDIESTAMFRLFERCMNDRVAEEFDNLFTYADGDSQWFDIRVEPVVDGIAIYSIDIHQRKLWQLELDRRASMLGLSASSKHRWRSFVGGRLAES